MATSLGKGTMQPRTVVTLQVVNDPTTGLAVNTFSWRDSEDRWHMLCELASPIMEDKGKEFKIFFYDPERDSKHAEQRRLELEATL